ncbi:MAG: protein rep [Massilia sp.]
MISITQPASKNLGISGKSINREQNQQVTGVFVPNSGRFQKYALTRRAGAILYDPAKEAAAQHRTCWCHRGVANAADNVTIYRTTSGDSARMHGVTTCKSVWTCPTCSARICAVRQAELSEGMRYWIDQGGYVFLLTLTFPHDNGEALGEILPAFTKAKAHFKNSKTYKRILAKGVRKGSVSSLEVTRGDRSGWHPHQHDLVFCTPDAFGEVKQGADGRLSSRLIDELKHTWYVALRKVGLCEQHEMSDVLAHGLDVRGGQFAAEYVAKFGKEQKWGLSREVTMHAAKVGTDNKGAHPFQLLAWAEEGDEQSAAWFREYSGAFEGKRMLSWSRGLKKELTGREEVSDEEAADQVLPEEEVAGRIDSEALSVLQSRRLLPNFLAYVAAYCSDPATAQADIDAYLKFARDQRPIARGEVKVKLWQRGFMHVNQEKRDAKC